MSALTMQSQSSGQVQLTVYVVVPQLAASVMLMHWGPPRRSARYLRRHP